MRLIDADTIEPFLKEERDFHKKMYDNMQQPCEHDDKQIVGAYYTAYSKSYRAIKDAPTIDAVPVVRCKDCKHRDPEDKRCDCGGHEWVKGKILPVKDDWFCADGERKDGERDA